MKFAHMADCHIGSWSDARIMELGNKAFEKAITICIQEDVEFVLIAGDLFNTALPSIDSLKLAVDGLKKLKDSEISVYVVPGSHDFSASGKTMLDVLEGAGLLVNVFKGFEKGLNFVVDKKTGVKITGVLGKRGGLEQENYKILSMLRLEEEIGFKIFMFHSALEEFRPKGLESMASLPLEALPKGFDYYAGGHVHFVMKEEVPNYGMIAYPGPIFPDNFKELEELGNGGFFIVEFDKSGLTDINRVRHQHIVVCNVFPINIDCNGKTPEEVGTAILEQTDGMELVNTIVTVRLIGELVTGKTSDIDFKSIFKVIQNRGALSVMKNTNKLTTKEFQEIKITEGSVEEIEQGLIGAHAEQLNVDGWSMERQMEIITTLMEVLDTEKLDGEKIADFEKRVKDDVDKVLGI